MNFLNPSRFVVELDTSFYELIDYSNNLIENYTFKSRSNLFKKNDSKIHKKQVLSQFTTADKLLKRKN